jgi:hypothetical protein
MVVAAERFTFDELVPDPAVAREFNVSLMTIWRWDQSAEKAALGWPPAVRMGGKCPRKFRSRSLLEQFKANLLRLALDGAVKAA